MPSSAAPPPCVIRLPNHLGDACMALPALERVATLGRTPVLVGRPWAASLLAAYPWRVLALPARRGARIAALRALRREGAREALLLTNSFSSALEFRLAGLRPAGYARDGRRLLLAPAVAVPPAWAADMHTVAYYWHLVQARWGLDIAAAPLPRLALADAARAQARAALARAGAAPDAGYVVLCPVAVGRHQGRDKCWSGFGRLDAALRARGIQTVICPGPGEREAASAAVPQARLVEALEVGAFAALLGGSRLVVANDSGPGHLAAAVGAPLVGVFGVTDPLKTRPLGPGVRIVGTARGWPAYEEVEAAVTSALIQA